MTIGITSDEAAQSLAGIARVEQAIWTERLAAVNEYELVLSGITSLAAVASYSVLPQHWGMLPVLLVGLSGFVLIQRFRDVRPDDRKVPNPSVSKSKTWFLLRAAIAFALTFPVGFAVTNALADGSVMAGFAIGVPATTAILTTVMLRSRFAGHWPLAFMCGAAIVSGTLLWAPKAVQPVVASTGVGLLLLGLGVASMIARRWGRQFP
jgi:hypothetical protein